MVVDVSTEVRLGRGWQASFRPWFRIGAVVTVTNHVWHVRGAAVNTAPTHGWAIGADNNPDQTRVFEAGGGITPIVGRRFGASFAHGKYATTKDAPNTNGGRMMTLIGGEAEYAFRYTRFTGEFIRIVGRRYRMGIIETTAGFRVNPAITLRGSYYTRRSYTASAWDRQFGVSVVWSQRWR